MSVVIANSLNKVLLTADTLLLDLWRSENRIVGYKWWIRILGLMNRRFGTNGISIGTQGYEYDMSMVIERYEYCWNLPCLRESLCIFAFFFFVVIPKRQGIWKCLAHRKEPHKNE